MTVHFVTMKTLIVRKL